MNKNLQEGVALATELNEVLKAEKPNCDVVICTPFIHLATVSGIIDHNVIGLGAENCADKASGAYTGEVSAEMVKSTGAEYVILGHSERREYYNETPEILKEKVDLALANGLKVIFCIGESLAQREANEQNAVVKAELEGSVFHLTAEQMAQLTTPLGEHFIEEMGSINLLAVRDIDGEHTLCFYAIHHGAGCDAAMATYDAGGKPCDAMLLNRCHDLWPVNPETFEGNLARELTAQVEFNGQRHFNLVYEFQEMVFDPSTDQRSAPQWVVKWHQDYDIDKDCHFVLKEQKEDMRTGNKSAIDEVVYMNMRLTTFATQSVNDPRVIDKYNKAIPEWEQFYKNVDLSYIDMSLNSLFDMNRVRLLQWMASHRGRENSLLTVFERLFSNSWVRKEELIDEMQRMTDPSARSYMERISAQWGPADAVG